MAIRQYPCPECGHVTEIDEAGDVSRRQIDCENCEAERTVDALAELGFDTGIASYPIGSRGVIATSRGNETRLKRPLRVIFNKPSSRAAMVDQNFDGI